jgi:catechol 2,3-dioxygenase-like lactoylglutathione lyase family enzyme
MTSTGTIRRWLIAMLLSVLCAGQSAPAEAQLATPGDAGVVMGHVHLIAHDVDGMRRFWMALGGTPVQNGRLALIAFPGVFVMVQQGEPTAGTVGSVVNHFGFKVRNLPEARARWQAAGVTIDPTSNYLMGPEGVRVEMMDDPTLDVPIQMYHVHFWVPKPLETQAWYARLFGATPSKRQNMNTGDIPGANLTFSDGPSQAALAGLTETIMAGTRGRVLDHIGFDVTHLEQFCKRLDAMGVTFDRPYQRLPNSTVAVAFLTDPWGTYIELTENLAPPAR